MRRSFSLFATLGILFLLSPAHGKPDKDAKPKGPDYYPLEVGNAWYFNVKVGENTVEAVSRIVKTDDVKGETLARLEATANGSIVATEHLQQTEKGIFRNRHNGLDISPPICLLKFPVKADDKWDEVMKIGAEKGSYTCKSKEESVTVEAGTFKAIRVDFQLVDMNGKTVNTTYWFAPDVGIVKQEFDGGGVSVIMKLQKFESAKKNDKEKEKAKEKK